VTNRTDEESFALKDFHLEAAVDCTETETVFEMSHNVNYELSSPNYPSDYPDDYNHTWTITRAGATKMSVHFDAFNTEAWSDNVAIYDKDDNFIENYSGDRGAFNSVVVDGDTIKINFDSDSSVTYSGWHIDHYSYYETTTGTEVVAPKVILYFDSPSLTGYDFWGNIYKGGSVSTTTDISYFEYTETPVLTNYTDTNVDNNATYYYYLDTTGDNSAYYFRDYWQSETIAVPIQCADPIASVPQLNTGFNIDAEKINDNTVDLTWADVNGATQYFVTKDNVPFFSSSNWTNYFFVSRDEFDTWYAEYYANDVHNSTTNYLNYVTDTSFTDNNASLSNPADSVTYRIYAVQPDDFVPSDGYDDWDGVSYTWNSKYPWDHNYTLSEEVVVHGNGDVDETDPDPVDEGGTLAPCLGTCALDADCDTGLSCISLQCLNASCPTETGCECNTDITAISSLTDAMTNSIISLTSNHTLLYDIRIASSVTDGSLKIDFPSSFVFGSLAGSDITTSGGDVTWGVATINGNSIIIPFTGVLSSVDDRITIDIGNTNFITNPAASGNYNVSLSSHASNDGTGANVDLVSDRILIMSADNEGVSSISNTLSNSMPGYDSRHTIRYGISQSANSITNGSLKITLANEFNLAGLTDNDITILGGDVTWSSDKIINSGGTQIGFLPSLLNNIVHAQGENSIIFNFTGTLDSTDSMITIVLGDGNYINNPISVGPFSVTLTTYDASNGNGNPVESIIAMIHINDGVTVTANVPPSLTFTVTGVNMGTNVNGAVTNVLTTSTDVNFGVFTGADNKVGAQDLTVSTNATNGFVVTIQKEGDFISSGADVINDFTGTNASPTTWASPPGSGTESYFGYTTNDYTLSQTEINRFNTNMWAKAESTPYEVMYHTDPINGITQGQGTTRIGYQMEITNLQPAGIYQTKVMYVCTATF
jgi:hypothetical protein